jgi:hypothetical protein
MLYFVSWDIDIEADSPKEAAQKARRIQRDLDSIATIFSVRDPRGEVTSVDLEDEEVDDDVESTGD